MDSGIMFDIQRFALHDGPGIRTTVFLKGCPLRCAWCHNPESQRMETEYLIDHEACSRCISEGFECPFGMKSAMWTEADRSRITDEGIGHCPKQAIRKAGTRERIERIMAEVEEDLDFYRTSGGGLTISGGEPLTQADFVLGLAQAAKAKGIHVCLDTSGYAPRAALARVLPWIDLFLYDYKATGDEAHREWTGVSNGLIMDNLDFLMKEGAAVLLRCPLIPGVNDTPAHLSGILDVAARYPGIAGIHIMPYHDMGNHKAERIGGQAKLAGLRSADPKRIDHWLSELAEAACPVGIG